MKKLSYSRPWLLFLIISAFLWACDNHDAHTKTPPISHKTSPKEHCVNSNNPDGLFLEAGWARVAIKGRPVSAAYLTICNNSDVSDILTRIESMAAKATELHQTSRDQAGRVSMAPITQLKIDANSKTTLSQGGHHVMLIGLEAPLVKGNTIALDLYFQNAGKRTIMLPIRESPTPQSEHHNH